MASWGALDRPAAPQQPAAPDEGEEEEAGDSEDSYAVVKTRTGQSSVHAVARGRNEDLLSTEIDESLVRGVPLDTLLQGCGQAFRDHAFLEGDYAKSRQVHQLHDFLSHDWFSGRWDKFLALCLLYNTWPAIAVSSALGLIVGLLEVFQVLPFPVPTRDEPMFESCIGCWAQLVCPPVFFGVLFCWQHVPRWPCGPSRTVFLDKYCIDQGDIDRKRAGILGLGGFLKRSNRLVILWTPRYFTRLWCAFEVASWLHLQKSFGSVLFLPLAHAAMTVCCAFASAVLLLAYSLSLFLLDVSWGGMVLAGLIALGFPFSCHFMRHSVHGISRFAEELEQFSITKARCFCCSNNHRAPHDSSVAIPCDRELVELTVRAWFTRQASASDASSASLASLESFDDEFRGLFGQFVSKVGGLARLPYKYALVSIFPVMFMAFDAMNAFAQIPGHHHLPRSVATRRFVEIFVLVFFCGPSAMGLLFRGVEIIDRMVGLPPNRCLDLLASLVTAQSGAMVFLLVWLPPMAANKLESPWPFVACSVVEVVLTLVLYRKDLLALCFGEPAAPASRSKQRQLARR